MVDGVGANGRRPYASEFIAMQVIEPIQEMTNWSEAQRLVGRRIVFVPTMGFLHEGHLCLVRDAKRRGDRTVVSIFVNPAQFAPQEDFAAYPQDFERDQRLLDKEGIDILFHPPFGEMYPRGYQTQVEVQELSLPLCGAYRTGHFRGVASVVAKLFNIIRPHTAIFGCKDYQQLQVVRRLVRDLNFAIEVVSHPTVREPDGLAMSSRNAYLNPPEREAALCLPRSLLAAEALVRRGERRRNIILDVVRGELESQRLASVEYVSLVDAENLQDVDEIQDVALLALAVRIGKARLIDNKILKA